MHVKRTFVIVALAAAAAAPSALAQLPPGEGLTPGLRHLQRGVGLRPAPHKPCGGRQLMQGVRCFDPAF